MERRLAVALHDVEPATYERCALIRDWLADHGVERVTILVAPAAAGDDEDLGAWLAERRAAGDAVLAGDLDRRERRGRGLLRLDIHPADVRAGRRVAALERVLRRARHRAAVTYDAL